MKRILLGVLAVGIVLTIGATTAFASGMHNGYGSAIRLSSTAQTSSCPNYVDADGDGLCDNCGGSHGNCQTGSCSNYVDADGDGLCDNCSGSHGNCQTGNCSNYVDTDGDGLCDNCSGSHGTCLNNGNCSNYVDADGDGLCDNYSEDRYGCGNKAAWSGAGHHNGCREECRESRCGANRR